MIDPTSGLVTAALMTWVRPLWVVALGTLAVAAAFWIICWILQALTPRVYAIARAAAKEALSQPLAYVLIALGNHRDPHISFHSL